jgi:hypothetical protein
MSQMLILQNKASAANATELIQAHDHILAVMTSITDYLQRLKCLVNLVYTTTIYAYTFSKYIFHHAYQADVSFNINSCLKEKFFSEIWLSLTRYILGGRLNADTVAMCNFINWYKPDYL